MAETLETLENLKNTIDNYREARGFLHTIILPVNLPVYVLIGWGGFVVYINVATLALESTLQAASIEFIGSKAGTGFDGKYPVEESPEQFLSEDALLNIARAFDGCPDYDAENEEDPIQLTQLDCLLTALDAEINNEPVFPDETTDPTQAAMRAVDKALKPRLIEAIKEIVGTGGFDEATANQLTGKMLRDSVPFIYKRQGTNPIEGVANYAITASKVNFETDFDSNEPAIGFPYGDNDLTVPVRGRVNGLFTNYFLPHGGGVTGSAIFISEVLYTGGRFPMVSAIPSVPACDDGTADEDRGWRVCCETTQLTTYSWKAHQGIRGYYEAISAAMPDAGRLVGIIEYDFLSDRIRFENAGDGQIGGGSWRPGSNKADLYALFAASGTLASVDTGDYIFINQEERGAHGFLIIGWGTAVDCIDGLNADRQPSTQFFTQRNQQRDEIPYIVDFGYGYTTDGNKTGWLQDPRPRPFYASAATIDNTSNTAIFNSNVAVKSDGSPINDYLTRMRGAFRPFLFYPSGGGTPGGTNWQFIHMPDAIKIPFSRLYKADCEEVVG